MKKNVITKIVAFGSVAVLAIGTLTGCGKTAEVAENGEEAVTVPIEEEPVATAPDASEAYYFNKGVYVCYEDGAPKDCYYVFYDENSGYTEDATTGMGLPFSCQQEDGKVAFSFGGAEEEFASVLEVTSTDNGIITGAFEDGIVLNFELCEDADPSNFSAQNYGQPASSEAVYEDANGWKVKYNPEVIAVNQFDGNVAFVYTGESAGTNMITVTYGTDMKAKEAVDQIAESWGFERIMKSEGLFPGTDDVDGYWAILSPTEDGSGLYHEALARDYMEGYLMFESTGHNSGDDALDIAVSDSLAQIIDSIEFNN